MNKKKLAVFGIALSLLLGSSVTSLAAASTQKCPPHNYSAETFSHTVIETRSHTYVDGYVDGVIAITKTCTYSVPITYLNKICVDCGTDSGVDRVVTGGEFNHSACGK